jgi:4-amino-4-deoxy-L-arabinose transferase-like glycosyltransferase
VLGAATSVLTAVLALEFVGRRAALGAAFVVALYPASVLFSVYVLTEGLYGFLVLATLVTARRVSVARTAASGVLTGLAAMTRSLGIVMVPVLWAGYLWDARPKRAWTRAGAQCALLALACAITLGPWLRHTSRVSGGVMLDSASAVNVLLGNNPRARERLELVDFSVVWETYLGGPLDEADRNARAIEQSWAWIRSNPAGWLRLVPLKISYLWGIEGREHAWAYSNTYFGERDVWTVKLWGFFLMISFPLLALPAVVGLVRPGLLDSGSGMHLVVILAMTAALHVISFSETRFHLPLVPILAVLGARGLTSTPPMTGTRWVGALLVGLALAAGWWRQIPELLGRYAQLTVPEGWKTMLPY